MPEAEVISGRFKPRIVSSDVRPARIDHFRNALGSAFDGYLSALRSEDLEQEHQLYDWLNAKLHLVRDRIIERERRGD